MMTTVAVTGSGFVPGFFKHFIDRHLTAISPDIKWRCCHLHTQRYRVQVGRLYAAGRGLRIGRILGGHRHRSFFYIRWLAIKDNSYRSLIEVTASDVPAPPRTITLTRPGRETPSLTIASRTTRKCSAPAGKRGRGPHTGDIRAYRPTESETGTSRKNYVRWGPASNEPWEGSYLVASHLYRGPSTSFHAAFRTLKFKFGIFLNR